ncbi:MAG: hypothetical protein P1P58_07805 [Treponema sp.]
MTKHRTLFIGILAALTAGIFLFSSCNGLNTPKGTDTAGTPQSGELRIPSASFPTPPGGTTYTGYKIQWTDATGKNREKTISNPADFTFEGGLKAGTLPSIIPIITDNTGTPQEQEPLLIVPVQPDGTALTTDPVITANKFPQAPEGTTYSSYKVTWKDKTGKERQKTVNKPENLILEGGVQQGTLTITPIITGSGGTQEEQEPAQPDPILPPPPPPSSDWQKAVEKGITALENKKWDEALTQFKAAYQAEQNNTTRAYYALVQLASISIKPETVNFMKNRMGFETYPATLDALVNLEWFKEYEFKGGRYSTYYCDLQENVNGSYIRVNGRIINAGEEQAGQTVIDLRSCYERNTLDGLYSQRTHQLIQPEWVYAGSRTLYDHIEATPKQDREMYYHGGWIWQEGKQFVVEKVSETGNFMVRSWGIPAEIIPADTKRYSEGANHGWVDKDYEVAGRFPQVTATEWGKEMFPIFYIPAYLVEHSKDKNVDALVDELYGIIFGAEYTEAKTVLNSLNSTPVTVDKRLLKLTGLSQYFDEDSTVEVQKEQLLGVIGGFTLAKGAFEFIQSYSFNTDLSILKFDWENVRFDESLAQNINGYDQNLDPFNNGFLKGRSRQKLQDSKQSFIEGADVLIALYDSLTNHPNMPAEAQEEVKKLEFIKAVVTEVRNAIRDGRTANFLVGQDNMMKENFAAFELDMGKIFTYEYFKLSNAFEMNGTKPKVFPAGNGEPAYLQMKYKSFVKDFMHIVIKEHDGSEYDIATIFDRGNMRIPLEGPLGEKIKKFYE